MAAFPVKAQSGVPDSPEADQVRMLYAFCQYIRQTPESQWDAKQLQVYIMPSDSAWILESQQGRILQAALKTLRQSLGEMNPSEYGALPWQKFPGQNRLPKMAWEAEPLTQVMGQPIPTTDREEELAAGRKQSENILVVFKKNLPQEPVHYVLFDGPTGKIVSWILVNQGGLHYFLLL